MFINFIIKEIDKMGNMLLCKHAVKIEYTQPELPSGFMDAIYKYKSARNDYVSKRTIARRVKSNQNAYTREECNTAFNNVKSAFDNYEIELKIMQDMFNSYMANRHYVNGCEDILNTSFKNFVTLH